MRKVNAILKNRRDCSPRMHFGLHILSNCSLALKISLWFIGFNEWFIFCFIDEIKEKVAKRLDEISDMVEKGELEAEEGYALFKEFEDQMVLECGKLMEKEPLEFDESIIPDKKKDVDDPPGEGPILRWQTRVVFAPGGDAWHPKNRKVKLAVTVKELGLSKHQFRRLRELVGKRYHPGRDELTITSER
nr:uncharacterized protein LOC109188018 [Ipomoea batatas]